MSEIGGIVVVSFQQSQAGGGSPVQSSGAATTSASRSRRVLDRKAVGKSLLRLCLTSLGSADANIGRLCPRCGSTVHGRPDVDGFSASVSHAENLTVTVVGPPGAQLGIDVESRGRPVDGVAHALGLHGRSQDPLRDWVMREAAAKAWGVGLAEPLSSIGIVDARQDAIDAVATAAHRPPLELVEIAVNDQHLCFLAAHNLRHLEIRSVPDATTISSPANENPRTKELS